MAVRLSFLLVRLPLAQRSTLINSRNADLSADGGAGIAGAFGVFEI